MQAILINLAWQYIFKPLLAKAIGELINQMSFGEFIAWVQTLKSYHEAEDFPNAPRKPKSTCNLKTKDGVQVNAEVQ